MSVIFIWILWAIIETTNPNVSGFVLIDEFPDRKDCVELAAAIAKKGVPIPPGTNITDVTVVCIPVATRISKNAH